MSVMDEYYAALERLIKNKPINVTKGVKISNNSVALEAGRSNGSIKNSRDEHQDLILAIKEASKNKPQKTIDKVKSQAEKAKTQAELYRSRYEASLAREVMLLKRIDELENR